MVFPVTFLIILSVVIMGLGVFRYQEMSSLARRAARYASVHGTQYAKENSKTASTADDIYKYSIKPYAFSLDLSKLNYNVTWNSTNSPSTPGVSGGKVILNGNTVTVTLTYSWVPEALLGGITLTSTSVMPMSY
jgi:hypothetical protein